MGFSQVNYYIQDPGVKITFYHTDLKKPIDLPTDLIGNIKVATLEVLGGSKIYVITQRREIRDYYDNYVLLEKNHLTLELMLSKAALLSREAVPKRIHKIFSTVKFSDEDIKSMKALKPRYEMKKEEFNGFFHKMAAKIEQDYLQAKG